MHRLGDRWLAAGLMTVLFLIYSLGACRTIYVGDSGELVAAAHTLGIPHPSGYPLYVLLGKLWTLLVPFGSIAFRMSLFSAACAAAACPVLLLAARKAGLGRRAATLAALLLAFSPSFWSQANIQRVYALNALFLAIAVLLSLCWYQDRRLRWLAAAFFACGLGAANHTFMGVVCIAIALWTLLVQPRLWLSFRTVVAFGGSAATGLLTYLYLPLRSAADPRLDWGNPEGPGALLDVILRRDFWERRFFEGPADLLPITGDYLQSLFVELAWAGPALALIALVLRRRHQLPVLLPLLIMAGNYLSMALHGSRSDLFIWHRYYIPSYAMLALLAGAGAHLLLRQVSRKPGWVVFALPFIMLVSGWHDFDRSRFRIAEDFSRQLLASLPPGATLSASDDNILFVLIYLQLVEGHRPDVDLILQGVGGSSLQPLRFNPEEDPVYFTHHPGWDNPPLSVVPAGLCFRIWRRDLLPLRPVIGEAWLDGEKDPRVPKDYLTQNLIGHYHYMLGLTLEASDWTAAEQQYRLARHAAGSNDVLFYNLGLIYRRAGLLERSLAAFQQAHEINPRHLPSGSRPRASDRIHELVAELAYLHELRSELTVTNVWLGSTLSGSPTYHRGIAELLQEHGSTAVAQGHLRCAIEIEAGITRPGQCGSLSTGTWPR
jgi:tetratricopeptide (TPR) repeat protein